jgi:hypothetical protein
MVPDSTALLLTALLAAAPQNPDFPLRNPFEPGPAAHALLPFEEGEGRVRGSEAPALARLRAAGSSKGAITKGEDPDCTALDRALEAGRIEFARMQALQLQRLHGDHPALMRRKALLQPTPGAAATSAPMPESFELALPPLELDSAADLTGGSPDRRPAPGLIADAGFWWSDGTCLQRIFSGTRLRIDAPGGTASHSPSHSRTGWIGRHGPGRVPLAAAGGRIWTVLGGRLLGIAPDAEKQSAEKLSEAAGMASGLEVADLLAIDERRLGVLARSARSPAAVEAWWLEWDTIANSWSRQVPLGRGADTLLLEYSPPLEPPERVSPAGGIQPGSEAWLLDPGFGVLFGWDPWRGELEFTLLAARRALRPHRLPPPRAVMEQGQLRWAPASAPFELSYAPGRACTVTDLPEGEWLGAVEGAPLVWSAGELHWQGRSLTLGAPRSELAGWSWLEPGVFLAVLEDALVLGGLNGNELRVRARAWTSGEWRGPVSVARRGELVCIASTERALLITLR